MEENPVVHIERLERVSAAATISRHQPVLAIDAALIKRKSEDAEANPRKRDIHILHRGNPDLLQRMLNALQPSTYIRPHRHEGSGKAELVVLLSGSLGFITFFEDGTPDERHFIHLHPTKVLAVDCRENVWHTFFALEPDTVVLEAKAGPYGGADDKEFAPWAPDETSSDVQEYLTHLKESFRRKLE
jgi:cupin fold WbuC family metalloprotein